MRGHKMIGVALVLTIAMAACGGDDDGATEAEPQATSDNAEPSAPVDTDEAAPEATAEPAPTATPEPEPTSTPEPVEPLRILLTNDDGVMATGIDLVANALLGLPDIELTIVAPVENQSGTGDTLSEGSVTASQATTASGLEATAVVGTPGDSVLYGLSEVLTEPPHLIVSGINDGQNIGTFARISGTVGAVRVGARQGIAGLAASVGALGVEPEFESVIAFVVDWVQSHREELLAQGPVETGVVFSINAPSCGETGEVKGLLEVPLADEFGDLNPIQIDCSFEIAEPANDVEAFVSGWGSLAQIPEDLVLGVEGS